MKIISVDYMRSVMYTRIVRKDVGEGTQVLPED